MEQSKQISLLKRISFFNDFDDHELRQFLSVSKWLKVPEKTLIIKEDTVERIFYILVKGEVSVFKTDSGGGTVELTTLSTGDCFGEMSLVTEIKRTAGVVTTTQSYVLLMEPDIISTSNVFLQLKFFKRFCEILVSRLIMANERVVGKLVHDVDGKAKPAKKRAAVEHKRLGKGEPPFQKPVAPLSLPAMPEKKSRISKALMQRQIRSDVNLPVNPAVAAQLDIYRGGDCENTRAFADLICLDPVLAAKVLQIANSSIYRRSCAVATVPHAMIAVGIQNIQGTVAETIDQSHTVEAFSGFSAVARAYWQHSVVVGRIAGMLKDIIRINIPNDVVLAGLLHDLGVIPLDLLEPAFYPQLIKHGTEFKLNLLEFETDYIGTDHGQAGAWISEKLGFPQAYLDVMKFHHNPEKARDNILLVALVHLADIFASERGICIGGPECNTIPPIESFAWVMIQEQHKPFMEVNVTDFIMSFNMELDKAWDKIIGEIPLQRVS